MDKKGIENRGDCRGGRDDLRFPGDESLELAGSSGVRTPHHHLLAGARHPDLEQDPVRGISRQARVRRTLETPDERALAADDTRGAREIPARYGQPLRSRRKNMTGEAPSLTAQRVAMRRVAHQLFDDPCV